MEFKLHIHLSYTSVLQGYFYGGVNHFFAMAVIEMRKPDAKFSYFERRFSLWKGLDKLYYRYWFAYPLNEIIAEGTKPLAIPIFKERTK
jgi:hypothetical protein